MATSGRGQAAWDVAWCLPHATYSPCPLMHASPLLCPLPLLPPRHLSPCLCLHTPGICTPWLEAPALPPLLTLSCGSSFSSALTQSMEHRLTLSPGLQLPPSMEKILQWWQLQLQPPAWVGARGGVTAATCQPRTLHLNQDKELFWPCWMGKSLILDSTKNGMLHSTMLQRCLESLDNQCKEH